MDGVAHSPEEMMARELFLLQVIIFLPHIVCSMLNLLLPGFLVVLICTPNTFIVTSHFLEILRFIFIHPVIVLSICFELIKDLNYCTLL